METQTTEIHQGQSVVDRYDEARRYFMGEGNLNKTLARITSDLKEHGIDYMVIGAVALLAHGYPRFTEDIDLVLTPERTRRLSSRVSRLRLCSRISRRQEKAAFNDRRSHY